MIRILFVCILSARAILVASSNASACGNVNREERRVLRELRAHCSAGNFSDGTHCVAVISLFDARLARHIPFWLARQANMQAAASARKTGRRIAVVVAADDTALAQCRGAAALQRESTVCVAVDGGTATAHPLAAQHAVWRVLYIAVCAGASTAVFTAGHVFWFSDVVAVIQHRYRSVQSRGAQHERVAQPDLAQQHNDATPTLGFGMRTLLHAQTGGSDPRRWHLPSKLDPCAILVYTAGAAAGDTVATAQRIVLQSLRLDLVNKLETRRY